MIDLNSSDIFFHLCFFCALTCWSFLSAKSPFSCLLSSMACSESKILFFLMSNFFLCVQKIFLQIPSCFSIASSLNLRPQCMHSIRFGSSFSSASSCSSKYSGLRIIQFNYLLLKKIFCVTVCCIINKLIMKQKYIILNE